MRYVTFIVTVFNYVVIISIILSVKLCYLDIQLKENDNV